MDFIILKSDGSLQKQSLTRYIQQGSHGVDEIFIGWANATSSQTLQAVFTLPNQLTNTELGVFEEDYEYEPGETMSGWVITLTENQTRYNGALMVSARVILNGFVQVAYPFALCINETGVRPETDSGITLAQLDSYLLNIQNLVTGAVRQNTDAALSSTSENPVQNKVITSAIDAIKRGSFTLVDTTEYPTLQDFLDTEGEEGYLYLYPVNTSDEDEGYYQYIWENDLWIPLGTTKIDIANMVTTDTNQTITAAKTIKEELNFADKTNTSSTLNSIKTDEYGGMVFSRGGVSTFGVGETDIRFYNRHLLPNNGNTTYNLGSSSASWKDLYITGQIQSSGTLGIFGYVGKNTTGISIGNGIIQANRNFAPTTDGGRDLGSKTIRWGNLYLSGAATISGTSTREYKVNSSNGYYLDFDFYENDALVGKALEIVYGTSVNTKTINPFSNNTYDLGSANYAWKDLYLGGKITIKDQAATPHEWFISHLNDYYFGFGLNGNLLIYFNPAGVLFTRSLEPLSNNTFTLGASSKAYLTTYTQNINDGTHSIAVADIGKKLYKHTISQPSTIGAPLLIIISTDGEKAEDVAGVKRLLSGNGYVNAFCQPLVSSSNPQEICQIYSYLFTAGQSDSLDLRYIGKDSSNNLKTTQFLLNDAYTTTDTVSPMN